MKEKTSITSSLSNKGSLTDAEINAGFGFNTILKSPDLNGQLYDIDSQVDIITKEICNFLINNGVTINSGDNSQLATLMSSLLSAKQNTLVAGTGITIDENGVISAQASTPANIPLFYCAWLDSLPFNVSWVNANNYSWLYGSTYVGAYNRLKSQLNPVGTFSSGDTYYVCNFSDGSMQTTTVLIGGATVAQLEAWCSAQGYTYSGATIEEFKCYKTVSASSETIAGITITYYQTNDGKKIVTSDAEIANAESIYNATGVQWYYILDTVNQRFKLPRTKWGFVGYRDKVGKYVPESLPNITGSFYLTGASGSEGIQEGAFYHIKNNIGYEHGNAGSSTNPVVGFDASLSSSTYQDNAPVQQRATQMYLYFYLGSSDVEEITKIAGIKAETINNKADLDLNNINPSASAKEMIVSWGMPDYTAGVSKGWNNFTAETDGVIYCYSGVNANTNTVSVNGSEVYRCGNNNYTDYNGALAPVSKNDVITVSGGTYNVANIIFYPLKGVK